MGGNKKVIELEYPQNGQRNQLNAWQKKTQSCLNEVTQCKAAIKNIFKQHYSKWNPHWRNEPNRLKAPYVERIRVAKRKIGRMERDSTKCARLLSEIQSCVASNKQEYELQSQIKVVEKMERRGPQL